MGQNGEKIWKREKERRGRTHIPETTHNVVDMLAVLSGIGTSARSEAEFSVGNEGSPFVVLEAGAKGIPVDETTN